MPGPRKREPRDDVHVLLPYEVTDALEAAAARLRISRRDFIEAAIREKLEREAEGQQVAEEVSR